MITPVALRTAYEARTSIRLPTSGTSGRPRWVLRTAASWVDSFPVVAGMCGLSEVSRAVVPGPIEASMNAYAVCLLDWTGAALIDDLRAATHLFCTPSALAGLLDRDRIHGPLVLVVAGDRLSPALARRAADAGHVVHHYYGAAQLSFVAWGRDADMLRLFPRVRAEARDGELWVASPWLCLREEGPSPVLRSVERDGAAWMSVGDRGAVLADGRVVVAGRSDAVTTGGVTVVLADVEAALQPYAAGELLVVSRPHPRVGAVLMAVCTEAVDADALPSVARRVLPPSHRPRAWRVLPELPTTAAGKVDRTRIALS